MKKTLFIAPIILCALFLTSCKKDIIEKPKYPIVGLWTGTYNVLGEKPEIDSLYYSFDLKADNTMLVQGLGADGNTYYGTGSWSLQGTLFSATIKTSNLGQAGARQTVTANYDKRAGKLSGEVENVDGAFKGAFSLSRIN